ncbi:MAG: exo-alpha-sialidase [Alphaproteobacteria bacterium]
MDGRALVSTRKGLFTLARGRDGWGVERVDFLGTPVSMALADSRDGTLYAAHDNGHFGAKLHRRDPGGNDWRELVPPAFPKIEAAAKAPQVEADRDGGNGKAPAVTLVWELVAGPAERPGEIWAGTIPGGLFRSRDRGESWELVESLWNAPERARWFGGGKDEPGIHSIVVDPRDGDSLTLAISCGGVWKTGDAGASWTNVGRGMRASYMPPDQAEDIVSQDPHRLALCPAAPDVMWVQHHDTRFRSTDGGRTFVEIGSKPPSVFGFAVAAHPSDPATAWFVPAVKDEYRYPTDGRMVVARTRDGGESFEELAAGLPQTHAYDLVYRHGLAVDADGSTLVMGSTSGGVWLSEDAGDSWAALDARLPPVYAVAFAG